jgi:hypothetical protein
VRVWPAGASPASPHRNKMDPSDSVTQTPCNVEKSPHRLRRWLTLRDACAKRAAYVFELGVLYETLCWMGARFDHLGN